MYGVVLFAAMASAGPSCHCHSGPVLCCPVSYGCCGVVRFFWTATPYGGTASPEDAKVWSAYVEALRDAELADVLDLWKKADEAGRRKLLAQVKGMRPADKDREPDREVRTPHRSGRRVASNRP
jgi:hypothetical protein